MGDGLEVELGGRARGGRGGPGGGPPPPGLFPGVSGLSRRQWSVPTVSTASVAGLRWTGPACRYRSRCFSRPERSGCEKLTVVAVLLVAPFCESEQLGSHSAAPGPNVETDQPRVHFLSRCPAMIPAQPDSGLPELAARPTSLRASRRASRSAMSWRLSARRRPRARPSSTLARTDLK